MAKETGKETVQIFLASEGQKGNQSRREGQAKYISLPVK
jgi:hypothetical protein